MLTAEKRALVVEVLKAARASIDTPEKWGQGWNASGMTTGCKTMCAGIAFDRAYRSAFGRVTYEDALQPLRNAIDAGDIVEWNDASGRTHAEVMAAYDKAISKALEASAAPAQEPGPSKALRAATIQEQSTKEDACPISSNGAMPSAPPEPPQVRPSSSTTPAADAALTRGAPATESITAAAPRTTPANGASSPAPPAATATTAKFSAEAQPASPEGALREALAGYAAENKMRREAIDANVKAGIALHRMREALEAAREALNIDRTGLAAGLNEVKLIAKGYRWLPNGEWGSYSWEHRSEETLRKEVGWMIDGLDKAADAALHASGNLADKSVRAITAALAGQPARDKQEKLLKEGDVAQEYCDRCDGCGWYEGGKTLQTKCEDCSGTGVTNGK